MNSNLLDGVGTGKYLRVGSSSTVERITIDYTPHYHALTNTGKSHFSRIADATAELIDNSIQACSENSDLRNIHISIHVASNHKKGYLVVMDNGCGMDENGLRSFATYSLDQETRGFHGSAADRSFISKFGVGAKQAGFFLGSCIHVFTKKSDNEKVGELKLDIDEFKEKYERNENVFLGQILMHSRTSKLNLTGDEETFRDMADIVNNHVASCFNQFTVIIISLNPRTLITLFENNSYENLSNELADIYHFHLNPLHRPNNILTSHQTQCKFDPTTKERIKGFPYPTVLRKNKIDEAILPELNISFELWSDSKEKLKRRELRDIEDLVTQCVKKSRAAYRFNMTIPNPYPPEASKTTNAPLTQATQQAYRQLDGELLSSKTHTCTVEGILFYFPHMDGAETRPRSRNLRNSGGSDDNMGDEYTSPSLSSGYANSSQYPTTSQVALPGIHSQENSGDIADPTFTIYWQDRLVPESVVSKLPFFPDTTTRIACEAKEIPEKWRYRVKGFLFFDWTFEHISNNKLKIQIPHLDDWLNEKKRAKDISFIPHAPTSFLSFIQGCHKHFDREFIFEKRLVEIEQDPKRYSQSGQRGSSFFSALRVGNKFTVQVGDIVIINAQYGHGNRRRKIYGRIMAFEVTEPLPKTESKYSGRALLTYVREPQEVYGKEIAIDHPSVGCIDFTSKDTFNVKKDDLELIKKQAPCSFDLWLFNSESEDSERLDDNTEVIAGMEFFKIGIQLKNKKKEVVTTVPQSSNRYKIEFILEGSSWGTTQDLWFIDQQTNKDTKYLSKDQKDTKLKAESLYYSFYGGSKGHISFGSIGTFEIQVNAIDDSNSGPGYTGHIICSKKFRIKVTPVAASEFDFLISPESQNDWIALRRLGSFMPPFSIQFRDEIGNPAKFAGKCRINIKAKDMVVLCDDTADPIFELEPSEAGVIYFEDQWIAQPLNPRMLRGDVSAQQTIKFKVEVFVPSDPTAEVTDPSSVCIPLGKPKRFAMTFVPGVPAQLILLEPSNDVLVVANGDIIPRLRLGVVDSWSNPAAPHTGQNWQVELDPHGPLKCNHGIHFLTTGEAVLDNVVVTVDDVIPLNGIMLEQSFFLKDVNESEDQTTPELKLTVSVKPSQYPVGVRILHDGVPISQPWYAKAGSVISHLSFQLIDESSSPLPFDVDWFKEKSSGVTHWGQIVGRKSKREKPKSDSLPDIELPTKISDHAKELDFDVLISGGSNFSFQFAINLVPGEPVRWMLDVNQNLKDEGIMNGDSEDFTSKVSRAVLIDNNENVVPLTPSTIEVLKTPLLVVSWRDPSSDESWRSLITNGNGQAVGRKRRQKGTHAQIIKRSRNTKAKVTTIGDSDNEEDKDIDNAEIEGDDDDDNDYGNSNGSYQNVTFNQIALKLSANHEHYEMETGSSVNLPSNLSAPTTAWLLLFDSDNIFKTFKQQFSLMGGLPSQILVSSNSLNVSEPASSHDVSVTRFTSLMDLHLHIKDIGNKDAYLMHARFFEWNISSLAEGREKSIELAKEKNNKNVTIKVPTIKINKYFEAMRGADTEIIQSFDLVARASFTAPNGDTIDLIKASMHCRVVNINAVTGIELCASTSESTELDNPINDLELMMSVALDVVNQAEVIHPHGSSRNVSADIFTSSCDTPFPIVDIKFRTDDGISYVPEPEQLKYDIKYQSTSSQKVMDVSEKFSLQFHEAGKVYQLIPSERFGNIHDDSVEQLPIGQYGISVVYKEMRESMSALPSIMKTLTKKLKIRFNAGVPQYISPSVGGSGSVDNLMASNAPQINERVIIENLSIKLFDRSGNSCIYPEGAIIYCQIRRDVQFTASSYPELENSDEEGRVFGELSTDGMDFLFQHISLKPEIGLEDGPVDLMFTYAQFSNDEQSFEPVASYNACTLSFNFTTDAGRARAGNLLLGQLKDLNSTIHRYKSTVAKINGDLEQIDGKIKALIRLSSRANMSHLHHIRSCSEIDLGELNTHLETLRAEQEDREKALSEYRRPVIDLQSRPNKALLIGKSSLGFVVELGYVNDQRLAEILSWAANVYMDSLIVSDSETAMELYRSNVKVWAVEQMDKFKIQVAASEFRVRDHAEVTAGILPLPSLDRIPGNPRYLVNLIELQPDLEFLRESLFYSIFNRSILFDNMETAIAFRKENVQRGRRTATLYTLTGDRISSDGMLNPSKSAKLPERFSFVFGQQPAISSNEYKLLTTDINVAEELIPLIESRHLKAQQLIDLETSESASVQGTISRVSEIEAELDRIGFRVGNSSRILSLSQSQATQNGRNL